MKYYLYLFPVGLSPSRPGHVAPRKRTNPIASGRPVSRLRLAPLAPPRVRWALERSWPVLHGFSGTTHVRWTPPSVEAREVHACPRHSAWHQPARVIFLVKTILQQHAESQLSYKNPFLFLLFGKGCHFGLR